MTAMVQKEAELLAQTARMCLSMDKVLAQATADNSPAIVQQMALDNCTGANEVLRVLVCRYLRTL